MDFLTDPRAILPQVTATRLQLCLIKKCGVTKKLCEPCFVCWLWRAVEREKFAGKDAVSTGNAETFVCSGKALSPMSNENTIFLDKRG